MGRHAEPCRAQHTPRHLLSTQYSGRHIYFALSTASCLHPPPRPSSLSRPPSFPLARSLSGPAPVDHCKAQRGFSFCHLDLCRPQRWPIATPARNTDLHCCLSLKSTALANPDATTEGAHEPARKAIKYFTSLFLPKNDPGPTKSHPTSTHQPPLLFFILPVRLLSHIRP